MDNPSLNKIAHQMWCNEPFSQGRKATKRGGYWMCMFVLIKILKKGGKQYIYRVGHHKKWGFMKKFYPPRSG